jgi:hypothetical protein
MLATAPPRPPPRCAAPLRRASDAALQVVERRVGVAGREPAPGIGAAARTRCGKTKTVDRKVERCT